MNGVVSLLALLQRPRDPGEWMDLVVQAIAVMAILLIPIGKAIFDAMRKRMGPPQPARPPREGLGRGSGKPEGMDLFEQLLRGETVVHEPEEASHEAAETRREIESERRRERAAERERRRVAREREESERAAATIEPSRDVVGDKVLVLAPLALPSRRVRARFDGSRSRAAWRDAVVLATVLGTPVSLGDSGRGPGSLSPRGD